MDAGELDALRSDDGETRYRRCASDEHHHHLVCRHCGTAIEVEGPQVERWATKTGKEHGFLDITHTVEIIGTCPDCALPANRLALRRFHAGQCCAVSGNIWAPNALAALKALAFARSGIQSPSWVVMREELGARGQDVRADEIRVGESAERQSRYGDSQGYDARGPLGRPNQRDATARRPTTHSSLDRMIGEPECHQDLGRAVRNR